MTNQSQNILSPQDQVIVNEELKLQIAKRNDYEHSSVKNFSKFFEQFLTTKGEKLGLEITEEILEEMHMQRAFLGLDTEFSLSADLKKAFESDQNKLNYALEVLVNYSRYLEEQINEIEENFEYEDEGLADLSDTDLEIAETLMENDPNAFEDEEELEEVNLVEEVKAPEIVKNTAEIKQEIPQKKAEEVPEPKKGFWGIFGFGKK